MLAGKGTLRLSYGNKEGKGVLRFGYGSKGFSIKDLWFKKKNSASSFNKLWNTEIVSEWT